MAARRASDTDEVPEHVIAAAEIRQLHTDAVRCAEIAGLTYVGPDMPGIARHRRGRGFSYRDAHGKAVDTRTRDRIRDLVIPPAWQSVWICTDPNGHLLATGVDDKGRQQYLYHERWRSIRDIVNFYRLADMGTSLPTIRAWVDAQLRRRTLDRDRVIAAMIRIMDAHGLRIGNEVYAEENESIGLCTLLKRHVSLVGRRVRLTFPGKSGQPADITITDSAVVRVIEALMQQSGRRLFHLDRQPIFADDVNGVLSAMTDGDLTAKDFRTWRGTTTAFDVLCAHRDDETGRDAVVIQAVDSAAEALNNTRAVARAHYVHPHVVEAYLSGTFSDLLARSHPSRRPHLEPVERSLLGFLAVLVREVLPGSMRPPGLPKTAPS